MRAEYDPSSINIVSYTVRDAFGDFNRGPDVRDHILDQDPTAAFFAEAYNAHEPGAIDDITEDFVAAGYGVIHVPQELVDTDRPDAHGAMLIAKDEVLAGLRAVPLAGRYALLAEMYDPETDTDYDVFGLHANDKGESWRNDDVDALGDYFPVSPDGGFATPTIVTTQGGIISRAGLMPGLLRAAGPVVRHLPASEPGAEPSTNPILRRLERFGSVSQRLSDVAIGAAYETLEGYGLDNADPTMHPTLKQAGISLKFGHILHSPQFSVLDHTVHPVFKPAESQAAFIPLHNREISARLWLPTSE